MKIGTRAVCVFCNRTFVRGVRPMPEGLEQYCSEACATVGEAHEEVKVNPDNDELVRWFAQPGELGRVARAAELMRVHCNSCVTSMAWSPVLDGSNCPDCGYQLSLYGPFEQPPTLVPAPTVMLERRW